MYCRLPPVYVRRMKLSICVRRLSANALCISTSTSVRGGPAIAARYSRVCNRGAESRLCRPSAAVAGNHSKQIEGPYSVGYFRTLGIVIAGSVERYGCWWWLLYFLVMFLGRLP